MVLNGFIGSAIPTNPAGRENTESGSRNVKISKLVKDNLTAKDSNSSDPNIRIELRHLRKKCFKINFVINLFL